MDLVSFTVIYETKHNKKNSAVHHLILYKQLTKIKYKETTWKCL